MNTDALQPVELNRWFRRILVAFARAMVSSEGESRFELDEQEVTQRCGLTLAAMPVFVRVGFLVGLLFVELAAVFRHGTVFSRCSPHRQLLWLQMFNRHSWGPVRMVLRLMLLIIKPLQFAQAAAKAQLGYEQPGPEKKAKPSLKLPEKQLVTEVVGHQKIRCQVVIVGTGAGGGVLAAELAEQGVDVVMLEAGRFHASSEFGAEPIRQLAEMYTDGGATMTLGVPPIPLPLGRTVGGTTTINSGTVFRMPDRVLKEWNQAGLNLDSKELAECYSQVEEAISATEVPPHLLGGSSHVIARGAEALGLAHGPLHRNIRNCQLNALCCFGCPSDGKQSTGITHVPRAMNAGARLFTGVRATDVLVAGGRASGVIAQAPKTGGTLEVHADVVVSACGTVSGVPFLKTAGIRSPHLGRHLAIQPATKVAGLMNEEVRGWRDTPQGYGVFALEEQGIMMEGAFMPPEYATLAIPFVGEQYVQWLERYPNLALFGFMVRDASVGRVRPLPGGRFVMTYNLTRADLNKVQLGLETLTEIFFAAGAERVLLPLAGREEHADIASARKALKRPLRPWDVELIAFHPVGTARMSARPDDGVVDPWLQCWELPGLYVVDGSVFRSSLGVNPSLTIMALATRTGRHLAAKLGHA